MHKENDRMNRKMIIESLYHILEYSFVIPISIKVLPIPMRGRVPNSENLFAFEVELMLISEHVPRMLITILSCECNLWKTLASR